MSTDRVAWIAPSDGSVDGELRVRTWGAQGSGDLRIPLNENDGASGVLTGPHVALRRSATCSASQCGYPQHGSVERDTRAATRRSPVSARQIMTGDDVRRALVRIGHEIVEKHGGAKDLALVGIHRRGVPLAERLAVTIAEHEGARVPVGSLDITFHRDDRQRGHEQPQLRATDLPFDLAASTVVIVGRRALHRPNRSCRDGHAHRVRRPAAVRLAVLVDRGHRELPIRADHVGKNVPTSREETVRVRLQEIDGTDEVLIEREDEPLALAGAYENRSAT